MSLQSEKVMSYQLAASYVQIPSSSSSSYFSSAQGWNFKLLKLHLSDSSSRKLLRASDKLSNAYLIEWGQSIWSPVSWIGVNVKGIFLRGCFEQKQWVEQAKLFYHKKPFCNADLKNVASFNYKCIHYPLNEKLITSWQLMLSTFHFLLALLGISWQVAQQLIAISKSKAGSWICGLMITLRALSCLCELFYVMAEEDSTSQ